MTRCNRQRSTLGLFLGMATMLVALEAPAQPRAGPPGVIISEPRTAQEAAMQKSMEEQGKAFAEYQKCVNANAAAVQLYAITDELVKMRENRRGMESALLLDPKVRLRYPGGYDQMLTEGFARYRALGGQAASVAGVQPMPPPCPHPGARVPPPRPGMPVTDAATKATPVR